MYVGFDVMPNLPQNPAAELARLPDLPHHPIPDAPSELLSHLPRPETDAGDRAHAQA
jgi:hypothetical protein